jgi:hypothetical protein
MPAPAADAVAANRTSTDVSWLRAAEACHWATSPEPRNQSAMPSASKASADTMSHRRASSLQSIIVPFDVI